MSVAGGWDGAGVALDFVEASGGLGLRCLAR